MLINEACRKSKLTKKAIEYYTSRELISPRLMENGYRDYSEADIGTLKEISVLRKCGLSVTDIKGILRSKDKSAALAKRRYITEIRLQRLHILQQRLDKLIEDYDIEREFAYLQTHDEALFTIKERLVLAFPGNYGLFVSLHFGRFLNEIIDTDGKRKAYNEIINYLDSVELYLPSELTEYLEQLFVLKEKQDIVQLEKEMNAAMSEALENTENYLEEHGKEIAEYLAFKNSDAFKNSPAGTLQKMLLDFQKQSGYLERFVNNIRVLSSSYDEYLRKLTSTNEEFVRAFPQAKDMYDL